MNEYLRDRIVKKLETLSDERLYQILDYVEFLETKYAERPAEAQNIFTRFAETVESKLRAGQVSASTVAETMKYIDRAMGVLGGVAAAGKSVANDLMGAARQGGAPPPPASGPGVGTPGAKPPEPPLGTNQPPGERRP